MAFFCSDPRPVFVHPHGIRTYPHASANHSARDRYLSALAEERSARRQYAKELADQELRRFELAHDHSWGSRFQRTSGLEGFSPLREETEQHVYLGGLVEQLAQQGEFERRQRRREQHLEERARSEAQARRHSEAWAEHRAQRGDHIPASTRSQQNRDSNHPQTASSPSTRYSTISSLENAFEVLKSGFTFPAGLDFAKSSPGPVLAYSATNAALHYYENELNKLLSKLDAVESDGVQSIRDARKGLVRRIEEELEGLDKKKWEVWRVDNPEAIAVHMEVEATDELAPAEPVDTFTPPAESLPIRIPIIDGPVMPAPTRTAPASISSPPTAALASLESPALKPFVIDEPDVEHATSFDFPPPMTPEVVVIPQSASSVDEGTLSVAQAPSSDDVHSDDTMSESSVGDSDEEHSSGHGDFEML